MRLRLVLVSVPTAMSRLRSTEKGVSDYGCLSGYDGEAAMTSCLWMATGNTNSKSSLTICISVRRAGTMITMGKKNLNRHLEQQDFTRIE